MQQGVAREHDLLNTIEVIKYRISDAKKTKFSVYLVLMMKNCISESYYRI